MTVLIECVKCVYFLVSMFWFVCLSNFTDREGQSHNGTVQVLCVVKLHQYRLAVSQWLKLSLTNIILLKSNWFELGLFFLVIIVFDHTNKPI